MGKDASDYTGRNDLLQGQCTTIGSNSQCKPVEIRKRLGSTTYRVTVYFSDTSKENLNDKILRLVQNEAMQ